MTIFVAKQGNRNIDNTPAYIYTDVCRYSL